MQPGDAAADIVHNKQGLARSCRDYRSTVFVCTTRYSRQCATNSMTMHSATLRRSQLLPPFTHACLDFITLTSGALSKNHIVSTLFETIHEQRSLSCSASRHENQDPDTQPSEPIMFPNYLADSPRLRRSMGQRLLTLETWRGYGYERVCEYVRCSRALQSAPGTSEDHVLYPLTNPTSKQPGFSVRST